ncbi:hypothetical protein NC651_020113 [Populus alba x Populus x berolinensis]|nr:hypothetical protein NC651_020113 [Populus alba x Populus x berolinensis]
MDMAEQQKEKQSPFPQESLSLDNVPALKGSPFDFGKAILLAMTMVDALKLVRALAPSAPSKSNTRWDPRVLKIEIQYKVELQLQVTQV